MGIFHFFSDKSVFPWHLDPANPLKVNAFNKNTLYVSGKLGQGGEHSLVHHIVTVLIDQ